MAFNSPGFVKDFNFPGDAMGEYNGMYAAVTDNQTYDPTDPTSGVDLTALLQSAGPAVKSAISTIQDTKTAITAVTQPTLTQQWINASLMEKVTLGIVAFIALRWAIHDFR
jgi:hypothetical protein